MHIVKAAVLGLAIVGFTAGTALACGFGKTANSTPKPTTQQSTVTNDTKQKQ